MLLLDVPADTTLDSLFADVLPRAHREMVPDGGDGALFSVVYRVRGWKTLTLDVRGKRLDVRDAAADRPDFWVCVDKRVVETFLEDWKTDKRLLPQRFPEGAVSISDPRVLRRLALISAKAELALTDVGGERLAMTTACGAAAKGPIDPDDPEVVLESDAATFVQLVEGRLRPEDAIVDGGVRVRGKRMLAMQLALAFAPFYPTR
jgi:hypothetical protein